MLGRLSSPGRLTARVTALAGAVVTAGAALLGAAVGTGAVAGAQPGCPDVHFIGAAGSGERDAGPFVDGGMGTVVYRSYLDLQRRLAADGSTVTAEPVDYPAVKVPDEDDILGWAGFIGSVDTGVDALARQYQAFVQRCPASKVVLAGYSQGAMVVHRNLPGLVESPNLAAALLIADGYRLPGDTTIKLGSAAALPGRGTGVGQDWPILAKAPTQPLPPVLGARTVDVCDLGDPVCDYDPDADSAVTPAGVAIHTSYVRARGGQDYPWTPLLYQLVTRESPTLQAAAPNWG